MKVKVNHYRFTQDGLLLPNWFIRKHPGEVKVTPRGGYTTVELFDEEGKHLSGGVAACCLKDNYNKKIGRMIATGRAMKKLREVPASFEYRELTDSEAAAEEATWD